MEKNTDILRILILRLLTTVIEVIWTEYEYEYLRMFSQDVIRYHPVLSSAQTERRN